MIFYFSGTGNSQLAAKQIAKAVGDKIVSINSLLKEGKEGSFHSERPLVFVAPTYAWRLPRVVTQWISQTRFTGNQNAYFILTCGGDCGNAASYAHRLCEKKGFAFSGLASVVMPENYLAMFPTPDEAACRAILDKAKPQIAALAGRIKNGEPFLEKRASFAGRLLSGPVNGLFYTFQVRDKGFRVSDACVSCGKCAERCPLNNVALVNGKPVWKGNCTHCMACIGGCPTAAIEYQTKSKGRHRYYIMEDENMKGGSE